MEHIGGLRNQVIMGEDSNIRRRLLQLRTKMDMKHHLLEKNEND